MKVLSVAIALAFAASAFGQPSGWVEVPQKRHLSDDRAGCRLDGGLYDREKLRSVMAEKPNCQERLASLEVDHETESLINYHAGSDCHMRVAIKVFRVDRERKYKFILNNIYGGCRAGGWRSGWVVIDKIPPGYNLEMHEVRIDRIHGPIRDEGFAFPTPPADVNRESLETRQVDLTDCLPLAGQSQWILRTREHIERALADKANSAKCLERIDDLDIDLTTHMLAGYSFASGHCARPAGLELTAVHEASSDPKESRFIVTAFFDEPRVPCRAWTTWPVWLVVPRLPDGYRMSFEAKVRP